MQLNEVIKEVGMTKRAVKYYEEKGLLSIKKELLFTVGQNLSSGKLKKLFFV